MITVDREEKRRKVREKLHQYVREAYLIMTVRFKEKEEKRKRIERDEYRVIVIHGRASET